MGSWQWSILERWEVKQIFEEYCQYSLFCPFPHINRSSNFAKFDCSIWGSRVRSANMSDSIGNDMGSLRIDSELMTNYLSAVPVPAGSHFVTVLDERRQPMVFALSNDEVPKLQCCKYTSLWITWFFAFADYLHSELLDISYSLRLPADCRIQIFHVEQSQSLKLHLCLAYALDSKSSRLVIAKPFQPDFLREDVLLDTAVGPDRLGTVENIYMGS